eukprot:3032432-Pyramimonas_sp.AAC.2
MVDSTVPMSHAHHTLPLRSAAAQARWLETGREDRKWVPGSSRAPLLAQGRPVKQKRRRVLIPADEAERIPRERPESDRDRGSQSHAERFRETGAVLSVSCFVPFAPPLLTTRPSEAWSRLG